MLDLILDKRFHWLMFLGALTLSLASLYFEHVVGLKPCPLCIMQRIAMFLLTCFLLAKLIEKSDKAQFVYCCLAFAATEFGLFIAARQVYLQSLPEDKVPACGPSLEMLYKYFPLKDLMYALFYGTGDCAKIDWTLFGLSMAFWSMLVFIGFSICLLLEIISRRQALIHSRVK